MRTTTHLVWNNCMIVLVRKSSKKFGESSLSDSKKVGEVQVNEVNI